MFLLRTSPKTSARTIFPHIHIIVIIVNFSNRTNRQNLFYTLLKSQKAKDPILVVSMILHGANSMAVVRDVKRVRLARNMTIQTRNRPEPLIIRLVTILSGFGIVTGRFRNMDPLNRNQYKLLPCWTARNLWKVARIVKNPANQRLDFVESI